MWALRLLTGPQAGQIFPLQPGKSTIGRGSACEVKIDSNSVSKEHAVILVMEDKLILTDLNSRNGTFVNGVRIQNQRLNLGDKMSLHDMLIDVLQVPNSMSPGRPMVPTGGVYSTPPPVWAGNAAIRLEQNMNSYQVPNEQYSPGMNMHAAPNPHDESDHSQNLQLSANSVASLFNNFKIYIDSVAMPGLYHVAQQMPFRYAVAALVGLSILTTTSLSTLPVVTTTQNNIRQESMRRAKTIARQMAASNRQALLDKNELQISIRSAELEEGVTSAILVNAQDGTTIAPASKRGEFVNKPFVNKARREDSELSSIIDDSNIGVSVPIKTFNPESGQQSTVAYAIILYDMGSLAMNSTATFTLFIENLGIALLIGALLYFFLCKLIENPLDVLNSQLDEALREGRDDLRTSYQFPALERLSSNINSALSRIGQGSQPAQFQANRDGEAANLVRMARDPALAINAIDERIIVVNPAFDKLIGGNVNLTGRPITDIMDPALQANLGDLIAKMRADAGSLATNELPFPSCKYFVTGQAVLGSTDAVYFYIVLSPVEDS